MSVLRCPGCGAELDADSTAYACACGELLDVEHDAAELSRVNFEKGSGVWRFRALVDPAAREVVSLAEGDTPLLYSEPLARFAGLDDLSFKHEGRNPTGSFKDRGMTVAVSRAKLAGAKLLACASTGNTAASLAAYAAAAELPCVVLAPEKATALGKLSQAIAHGARTVLLRGDFDAGMKLVRAAADEGRVTLLNSANPWRIEGQKTIVFEILRERGWDPPDWIVFPAGNLGNCAAFGKALHEARDAGLIDRLPRLAAVQAAGAAPFAAAFERGFDELRPVQAETMATAIRIGAPVSYARAVRSIRATNGVVLAVDDEAIAAAKRAVDTAGLGAEPASCASLAGAARLVTDGTIERGASAVCVLTGHLLKDADANLAVHAENAPIAVTGADELSAMLSS